MTGYSMYLYAEVGAGDENDEIFVQSEARDVEVELRNCQWWNTWALALPFITDAILTISDSGAEMAAPDICHK